MQAVSIFFWLKVKKTRSLHNPGHKNFFSVWYTITASSGMQCLGISIPTVAPPASNTFPHQVYTPMHSHTITVQMCRNTVLSINSQGKALVRSLSSTTHCPWNSTQHDNVHVQIECPAHKFLIWSSTTATNAYLYSSSLPSSQLHGPLDNIESKYWCPTPVHTHRWRVHTHRVQWMGDKSECRVAMRGQFSEHGS